MAVNNTILNHHHARTLQSLRFRTFVSPQKEDLLCDIESRERPSPIGIQPVVDKPYYNHMMWRKAEVTAITVSMARRMEK